MCLYIIFFQPIKYYFLHVLIKYRFSFQSQSSFFCHDAIINDRNDPSIGCSHRESSSYINITLTFADRKLPRKIRTKIKLKCEPNKASYRWKKCLGSQTRSLTINRANERCSLPHRFVKSIVRFR